ncbi:MAG: NAD-dependent epimerase/dehydratase family protein [Actinobacteria bacterium]|nr:NAD-dependent epimerase/dehydratase family protein [Actinomycetota bacterium]MBM3709329.1 NAD-dependent epimerase/dehydratase family protein [Actinomycetota bacterium]
MKILITGIAGFVGRHLLSRIADGNKIYKKDSKKGGILKRDDKILGVDLKIDNTAVKDLTNIFSEIDLQEVNLVVREKVYKVVEKFKPEKIYHLAAQSSVSYSWNNPVETMETNVFGGLNIFNAVMKYCQLCKILVACTAEEYAGFNNFKNEAIKENFKIEPANPYAISKAAIDFFAATYYRVNRLPVYISRSFNHIGPGQSDRFVASDFAKQIVEIENGKIRPVMLVGNIEVYRDFLDVRDVVEAYCAILEKGRAGEAYNVCSGIKRKISDILDVLLSYSSVKNIEIKVDKSKMRPIDVISIYGDNSKLKLHTGWKPEYDIKGSLKDTLNWWRERSKVN